MGMKYPPSWEYSEIWFENGLIDTVVNSVTDDMDLNMKLFENKIL